MDEAAPQAARGTAIDGPRDSSARTPGTLLAALRWSWDGAYLITGHPDGGLLVIRNLKLWYPWETKQGGWLATWMGKPDPGEHREAVENKLYDWLEASLGGTS